MCNHYRLMRMYQRMMRYTPDLHEEMGSGQDWNEPEHIDIWPTKPTLISAADLKYPGTVVRWDGDKLVVDQMAWGIVTMIPGASGKLLKKAVTNVRNLTSRNWKATLSAPSRRCLVPFSQFAEPKKGTGRGEHWFTLKEQGMACFAGIWRESEGLPRFAFLTCEPNPIVQPHHEKAMPVILQKSDEEKWMHCTYDEAVELAAPFPSQMMGLL